MVTLYPCNRENESRVVRTAQKKTPTFARPSRERRPQPTCSLHMPPPGIAGYRSRISPKDKSHFHRRHRTYLLFAVGRAAVGVRGRLRIARKSADRVVRYLRRWCLREACLVHFRRNFISGQGLIDHCIRIGRAGKEVERGRGMRREVAPRKRKKHVADYFLSRQRAVGTHYVWGLLPASKHDSSMSDAS